MASWAVPSPNAEASSAEWELRPPSSLWLLIEENVPPAERGEVRAALGDGAVTYSQELHAEMECLLEIWREVCSENGAIQDTVVQQSRPRPLADPPSVKAMLRQEIRLLLLGLREKARQHGRDETEVMSRYSQEVVEFAMDTRSPSLPVASQPPGSYKDPGGGSAGRQKLRHPSTGGILKDPIHPKWGITRPRTAAVPQQLRPLSSLSMSSNLPDEIEALKEKLNVSRIDEVIEHLRSLLNEECSTLEKDIQSLQEHLAEGRRGPALPRNEPSITELKEQRKVLESDLRVMSAEERTSAPALTTRTLRHVTLFFLVILGKIHDRRSPGEALAPKAATVRLPPPSPLTPDNDESPATQQGGFYPGRPPPTAPLRHPHTTQAPFNPSERQFAESQNPSSPAPCDGQRLQVTPRSHDREEEDTDGCDSEITGSGDILEVRTSAGLAEGRRPLVCARGVPVLTPLTMGTRAALTPMPHAREMSGARLLMPTPPKGARPLGKHARPAHRIRMTLADGVP
ncbi:coiled-coil domain-containing protein 24 isoform X3 [Lethenteron reissneri]|uniref:coiled-coil domain-containing protein 24 isoform X3 n=1 Tax=Lethenteron reissneri TaxID=7753 RepID=UPI002AB74412|nr:coiled-coil domain-containing protein 24 isoform X3 [Lethenteron reissneri]